MAIQSKATLKTYFEVGDKPTQLEFEDLIDSLLHVNDGGGNIIGPATILVSPIGDDSTGARGDMNLAFRNPTRAIQVAQPGDTILVLAGDYVITQTLIELEASPDDSSLVKDQVTWYFQPGAKLSSTVDFATGYIPFKYIGNNVKFTVLGDLSWTGKSVDISQGTNPNSPFQYGANHRFMEITGNNNDVYIEAYEVDQGNTPSTFGFGGTDNKLGIWVKGTWTHRLSTGFSMSGAVLGPGPISSTTASRNRVNLKFGHILSEEFPFEDVDYTTPIFYVHGADNSEINIEFDTCYATQSDNEMNDNYGQAREGQLLSLPILENSRLTLNGKNYVNDYPYAMNEAIFWLRATINADVSIHVDQCESDELVYGVFSLYNQNNANEGQHSRYSITGNYVANNSPCISDLGHYGSANVHVDDQLRINANLVSKNDPVVKLQRAATDFELSGEIRCDWDDPAGHGISLEAAGANLKLRDLEIVCKNASAKAIESTVGELQLQAFDVFSHTNVLGDDIVLIEPEGFHFPRPYKGKYGEVPTTNAYEYNCRKYTLVELDIETATADVNLTLTNPVDAFVQTMVIKQGTGLHNVIFPAGTWMGGTVFDFTTLADNEEAYCTMTYANGRWIFSASKIS